MKHLLTIIAVCMLCHTARAQHTNERIHYAATYQFGLMAGKAYNTYNAQIIQGISYKHYRLGAGIGIDPYAFRTVPLFASLEYLHRPYKNSGYVYTHIGASMPWNDNKIQEKDYNGEPWHKLYSGFFAEAGIGYRMAINKHNAIVINGGYSFKRFRYTEQIWAWTTEAQKQTDWYFYNYHRLTFRIGLSF